jgi:acetyl-CoA carboxylase biotin carboxylase subunit
MFKKILVANRGEIAVRVIRACRELEIPVVAVYSKVDRDGVHVEIADEAVCIGDPSPLESYLNIPKILQVAEERGCDAIHPGYGFLAENPSFAKACEDAGITFIGPTSEAIRLLGNKVESRDLMGAHGIPLIPGMMSTSVDNKVIAKEAEKIGFPVMIKAAAGGGGKGMRVVESPKDLISGLEGARREAKAAFADDTVYLEKYLEEPRHVEFQVLADHYGSVIHLYERECSIQRRHQKIVEESPSTALDDKLRLKMGETAVKVATIAGYRNAGTVEFLLDKDKNFYFLEVNTRIQVEHPVTECTTGVDLVTQQIRIAAGEKLSLRQKDIIPRGHAMECRIYAEDPTKGFLPSSGPLLLVQEPVGPGIRVDSGIRTGMTVTVHYDPILSKLICWGESRDAVCRRMVGALDNYVILGVETIIPFLKDIIRHPEFRLGNTTTGFIPDFLTPWQRDVPDDGETALEALAAAGLWKHMQKPVIAMGGATRAPSPWQTMGSWQIGKAD